MTRRYRSNPFILTAVLLLAISSLLLADSPAYLIVAKEGGDFTLIQDAIAAANNGDTIIIRAGSYTENMIISKSITILGSGDVRIVPENSESPVITVEEANMTSIRNLTIREAGTGIDVRNSSCEISYCMISATEIGIAISLFDPSVMADIDWSKFVDIDAPILTDIDPLVLVDLEPSVLASLLSSMNVHFDSSIFPAINSSMNVHIDSCEILKAARGVVVVGAGDVLITQSSFRNCGSGAVLAGLGTTTMIHNSIATCSQGISTLTSANVVLIGNEIHHNYWAGISLGQPPLVGDFGTLTLYDNLIEDNGQWAITLCGFSGIDSDVVFGTIVGSGNSLEGNGNGPTCPENITFPEGFLREDGDVD